MSLVIRREEFVLHPVFNKVKEKSGLYKAIYYFLACGSINVSILSVLDITVAVLILKLNEFLWVLTNTCPILQAAKKLELQLFKLYHNDKDIEHLEKELKSHCK